MVQSASEVPSFTLDASPEPMAHPWKTPRCLLGTWHRGCTAPTCPYPAEGHGCSCALFQALKYSFQTHDRLCFVMEYANGGEVGRVRPLAAAVEVHGGLVG